MTTLSISLVTELRPFPAATVPGPFRVTVSGAAFSGELVSTAGPYVFEGVPAGDYQIKAEALDASGAVLGEVVKPYTVAPEDVLLAVPVDIAVSV